MEAQAGLGLSTRFATWPGVLQKAGYATGLVGKWHLGERADYLPARHGLRFFEGGLAGGFTPLNPTWEVGGKRKALEGHSADLTGDAALRFLDANRDRPFALLVPWVTSWFTKPVATLYGVAVSGVQLAVAFVTHRGWIRSGRFGYLRAASAEQAAARGPATNDVVTLAEAVSLRATYPSTTLVALRGPNKKMSMPFEPFRTHTQPVNLEDLEARFDAGAEVTPESLRAAGLAKKADIPVKILGRGELSKKLTVSAHKFSKSARAAIEAAGGTANVIE